MILLVDERNLPPPSLSNIPSYATNHQDSPFNVHKGPLRPQRTISAEHFVSRNVLLVGIRNVYWSVRGDSLSINRDSSLLHWAADRTCTVPRTCAGPAQNECAHGSTVPSNGCATVYRPRGFSPLLFLPSPSLSTPFPPLSLFPSVSFLLPFAAL